MTRNCDFLVLVAAALALTAGTANAQTTRSQPVVVPERQAMSGVEIALDVTALEAGRTLAKATSRSAQPEVPNLRVGDFVEVCFRATASGQVTLWSRSAKEGVPVVIYPNAYSHAGKNARSEEIKANEQYCVGNDERFRLRVTGDPGTESSVYLHWTPDQSDQLGQEDFPVIRNIRSSEDEEASHASATIVYRLVD